MSMGYFIAGYFAACGTNEIKNGDRILGIVYMAVGLLAYALAPGLGKG